MNNDTNDTKTTGDFPAQTRTTSRNRGITRITAVILVAAVVVTVLTAVPFVIRWREESATFNCALSVEKMQDLVDTETIFLQRNMTSAETTDFLNAYGEMGEILCPDGGEFEVVERNSMSMEVVCLRHDSDGKRRVRLCGQRVLERVRRAVYMAQLNGDPYPDEVQITLNSRPLLAKRVDQPTGLRRGTATVKGYKGIVAFYALAGQPPVGDKTAAVETPSSSESPGMGAGSSDLGSSDLGSSDLGSSTLGSSTLGSSDSAGMDSGGAGRGNAASAEAGSSESTGAEEAAKTDNPSSDTGSSEEAESTQAIPFLPDGEVKDGGVWYLSYADEDHSATWTVGDGWRVDDTHLRG